MDKVAHYLDFSALGVSCRLDCPSTWSDQVLEPICLAEPFSLLGQPSGECRLHFDIQPTPSGVFVQLNGQPWKAFAGREGVLRHLDGWIHLELLLASSRVSAVHAGVVAFPQGALVIPGRSMQGKSTLVEALVRLGGHYFSDEFALLDDSGQVLPFPRQAMKRLQGAQRTRLRLWRPGQLHRSRPLAILNLEYSPGASLQVQSGNVRSGFFHLFANLVTASERRGLACQRLTLAAQGAHYWQGVRGDIEQSAAQVLQLCLGGESLDWE